MKLDEDLVSASMIPLFRKMGREKLATTPVANNGIIFGNSVEWPYNKESEDFPWKQ